MRKRLVVVSLFLLGLASLFTVKAQYKKEIDSLQLIIPANFKDTTQLGNLSQLAFYYSFTDSIKTFASTRQLQQLSAKWNYKPGIAAALRANANYFIIKRVPQKALPFL